MVFFTITNVIRNVRKSVNFRITTTKREENFMRHC